MNKKVVLTIIIMTCVLAGMIGHGALANPTSSFTLVDNGWTYTLDNLLGVREPFNDGGTAYFHCSSSGRDHCMQSWWWYRAGTDSKEYVLSNQTSSVLTSNQATLRYIEPVNDGASPGALQVDLQYALNGVASTHGRLTMSWTITNLSGAALPINLFSYSDFDLEATPYNDSGTVTAPNPSGYGTITFSDPATDMQTSTTAWGANSSLHACELGDYYVLWDRISNLNVDDLDIARSCTGPGDLASAFQWQFSLASGAALQGNIVMDLYPNASANIGSITGTITLRNFAGDRSLVPILVELMKGDSVITSQMVTTEATNIYTLHNVPPDTYSLRFTTAEFLRKVVSGVSVTSAGTTTVNVSLTNGDVNGDNEVTSTDLSALLLNLNLAGN